MTGRQKKTAEQQEGTSQPLQQEQQQLSEDTGTNFANIEPEGEQFANIEPS